MPQAHTFPLPPLPRFPDGQRRERPRPWLRIRSSESCPTRQPQPSATCAQRSDMSMRLSTKPNDLKVRKMSIGAACQCAEVMLWADKSKARRVTKDPRNLTPPTLRVQQHDSCGKSGTGSGYVARAQQQAGNNASPLPTMASPPNLDAEMSSTSRGDRPPISLPEWGSRALPFLKTQPGHLRTLVEEGASIHTRTALF